MPDAAETPPAGNAGDAAGIAGIAEKQPVDYIGMAALQEIAKRVEALELGQQSTTPKMVEEAVRPVKETLAKIAGDDLKTLRSAMVKIDTRLSALEGFAGRASLGLASKAFVAPPRDTGPKQGATTKRVLEVAAGAKSFSEFNERMRKLAKGPGGE